MIAGEPLNRGDDDDTTPAGGKPASITAIPKTKPKSKPASDGGMEPDPA